EDIEHQGQHHRDVEPVLPPDARAPRANRRTGGGKRRRRRGRQRGRDGRLRATHRRIYLRGRRRVRDGPPTARPPDRGHPDAVSASERARTVWQCIIPQTPSEIHAKRGRAMRVALWSVALVLTVACAAQSATPGPSSTAAERTAPSSAAARPLERVRVA